MFKRQSYIRIPLSRRSSMSSRLAAFISHSRLYPRSAETWCPNKIPSHKFRRRWGRVLGADFASRMRERSGLRDRRDLAKYAQARETSKI